jgi:hypothetical protein
MLICKTTQTKVDKGRGNHKQAYQEHIFLCEKESREGKTLFPALFRCWVKNVSAEQTNEVKNVRGEGKGLRLRARQFGN